MQFKGTKEGLSLYYTNADNLLFKLDELKVRIQLVSPDTVRVITRSDRIGGNYRIGPKFPLIL